MRTLIIAEAGVNHNGEIEVAKALIDVAADAGADIVKFQTFRAERLVVAGAGKAEYQRATTDATESQSAMLKRLELDREAHVELMAHCERRGIEFFSTAFDAESLELLRSLGARRMKIPSGELTNLPYLRQVGGYRLPTILSTGMATMDEVGAALDALERAGTPRTLVTVLHCNTEYPTPMEDVNLRAMGALRAAFGVEVGYSDHTLGIEVPIAAVALGATVIEKHFTLDRTQPGPDHRASLEPRELSAMVAAIRNVELALGTGEKRPTPSEGRNAAVARRSIVAARAIREGEVLTPENLTAKRPGTGISPMRWDEVVGRRAARDFRPDEAIEL